MLHTLLRSVTVLTLFLAGNAVSLYAQYSRLFNSDNELPNSLVTKVAETADDRIWIATEDGLCRFDGSSITTYRHTEGDSCSLANNFARTVCADQRGHLLVGTIAGVQMYIIGTQTISTLYPKDNNEPEVYERCGVKHFLFFNEGKWSAVWEADNIVCRINGVTEKTELLKMLDSIYERE